MSVMVSGTPKRSAAGRRNMFATECSKPIATKVEMGNHTATNLPQRALEAPASQTARLTIQLQRIAFTTVGPRLMAWHLDQAVDVQRAAVPPFINPVYQAAQANKAHPTTLPVKLMNQLRCNCRQVINPGDRPGKERQQTQRVRLRENVFPSLPSYFDTHPPI